MNKMVEQVALAIAKASGINDWFKAADEYKEEAIAAIKAMREPTQEMIDAGFPHLYSYTVWRAMIDAALKE